VSDGGKKLISFVLSFFEIVCERAERERERERERENRERERENIPPRVWVEGCHLLQLQSYGEKIKLYLSSAQSHTNIYSLSLLQVSTGEQLKGAVSD
jgi:hypothetical protein